MLTDVPVKHHRRLGKLLLGVLHYIQPLARGWARFKRVWQQQPRATRWPGLSQRVSWGTWRRRVILSYWTEKGIEKEIILQSLIQQLREGGHPTLLDSGWKPWDLAIHERLWSRIPIEVVVENHGASKRLARFRISWHLSPVAKVILWTCGVFLVLGMLEFKPWLVAVSGVAALLGFTWVTLKSVSAVQEMRKMIRDVADKLHLLPINGTRQMT
jgi:O-antigen biosynthesis protein